MLSDMLARWKLGLKTRFWVPYAYREFAQLRISRLYVLFDCLSRTEQLPGDVVEIGCASGGTSVRIARFLRETASSSRLVAIDTFEGFVESQFDHDTARGLGGHKRRAFSMNSSAFARRYAATSGFPTVDFVQGDICELELKALVDRIRVALVDVDLEIPTKASLDQVYPLLVPGGYIVVDDLENKGYGAGVKRAVETFCEDNGIAYQQRYGAAVLTRPAGPA